MPKETFFNLPDDKRNKILLSARREFTERELYKSRVSNIIKEAEIPRGSFYQYFEDLEDLYYYVIEDVFGNFFEKGMEYSDETDDLFEFAILTFDHDYDSYTNDKKHRFMMNVMRSISDNPDYVEKHKANHDNYVLAILNKMDLSKIRFNNNKELIKMYQMIQEVKRTVIHKSLFDNLSKEEAKKEIKWYIDILRSGLLKED